MNKQPNSRFCFLCGIENDHGLHLSWYNDEENEMVRTKLVVPDYYCGYPGITHGGIVSALLDETSYRAIMFKDGEAFMVDRFYVTANMNIRFRRPTPTGQPLTVVGWIELAKNNRVRVAAEIRLEDGTVTASCEALMAKAPKKMAGCFEDMGESWTIYPV